MRVAIVSTYPPRPCGIGTFSRDLRAALLEARDLGYRIGVLGSSEIGYQVYKRLGFQEYCRIGLYEWRPG